MSNRITTSEGSEVSWEVVVRMYRESLGLTVRDFAYRFGVSTQAVYMWESGKRQPSSKVTNELLNWMVGRQNA